MARSFETAAGAWRSVARDDVAELCSGAMDRDFLIDLFADFGPVTMRRMFSGFGISADGDHFALALRDGDLFPRRRADHSAFEAEGSTPFQYQTRAKTVTVSSYWRLPERLYDDPDELAQWARAALAAAQRAALSKRPKAKRSKRLQSRAQRRSQLQRRRKGQRRSNAARQALARDGATGRASASGHLHLDLGEVFRVGLRRSRGCGRCAWRRRGRRRRVRSANRVSSSGFSMRDADRDGDAAENLAGGLLLQFLRHHGAADVIGDRRAPGAARCWAAPPRIPRRRSGR